MKRPAVVAVVVAVSAVLAAGGYGVWWLAHRPPLPIDERCSATVGDQTTTVSVEQAVNAALISGVSIKRELAPRAASIALTTAYQESNILNLDYGHSDSLGLFQQRPSQGWGTKKQIMDPWYSSAKFYEALVRVKNWQKRDLGDVAQAVQRSAFPDAYDKHIAKARTLASSLSGETPASFTCALRSTSPADPAGLADFLDKTYGKKATAQEGVGTLTVKTDSARAAWSMAELAVATAKRFGVANVAIGDYSWTFVPQTVPAWQGSGDQKTSTVVITFAAR